MADQDQAASGLPRLVASTGDVYRTSVARSYDRENAALNGKLGNTKEYHDAVGGRHTWQGSNIFRSVEWTADGTSLVTVSEDRCIRTFIAPPDLLTDPEQHSLLPYSICRLPSTPTCISPFPDAALSMPSTAVFLAATSDHPIQLRSLLYPSVVGTYPLIHEATEHYTCANALTWTPRGSHFLAGTLSRIHLFDINREKDGPLATYATGSNALKGRRGTLSRKYSLRIAEALEDGPNVSGTVSALAVHARTYTVAAGTYSRQLLLYSSPWQDGDFLSCIKLRNLSDAKHSLAIQLGHNPSGDGVTHVSFTDTGHKAETNQRIAASVTNYYGVANSIVSGGKDGYVRVWQPFTSAAQSEEGFYAPVKEWEAAKNPVTGAAVHPTATNVVATSSGTRHGRLKDIFDEKGDEPSKEKEGEWDNGVRIWTV
ncbi:hypothetical protein ABW21_db0207825 [Orbilia brochopaga]|nr:hypothetical protein ABW21_db0207825 [Drechslerella brochopaga]